MISEEELKDAFQREFGNLDGYQEAVNIYEKAPVFKINENIFDKYPEWNDKSHFIMRWVAGSYIQSAFIAMNIDLDDPNVEQDLTTGNIGTPQRIAKMWCGANTHDTNELMCGRWSKSPRLASFPNENTSSKIPITKQVDIISVCSHHAAPFSSTFRPDGKAIISYIPDKKVLGISKLQRIVDWVSKRGWLQEDLTKAIYDEVSKVAGTKDVYVGLFNLEHSCESIRGTNSKNGSFTSEYYDGRFKKEKVRNIVYK